MTAIHVEVTADDIAAAPRGPAVGDGWESLHPQHMDPVEVAITRATGRETRCDSDGPDDEIATIGAAGTFARNVLVASTAPTVAPWVERYYKGEPVEPFSFDIEIEGWLVDLVRDPHPLLTLREAASLLGVQPATLRQQAQDEWAGTPGPSARARRLGVVKLGRDWFVDRVAVEREAAR